MKEYEIDELLSMAISVAQTENICKVYFLIHNKTIVYVGKATNLDGRLFSHKKDKLFDSYSYISVPSEEAIKVEKFYIDKFRPFYNDMWNKSPIVQPMTYKWIDGYIYLYLRRPSEKKILKVDGDSIVSAWNDKVVGFVKDKAGYVDFAYHYVLKDGKVEPHHNIYKIDRNSDYEIIDAYDEEGNDCTILYNKKTGTYSLPQ